MGRSLLSLLSVVIAVAAIVAVTSATDTTRKAYQQVFATLAGRADLEVVARGGGRFQQNLATTIKSLHDGTDAGQDRPRAFDPTPHKRRVFRRRVFELLRGGYAALSPAASRSGATPEKHLR